jgi:hypothetical protein
VISGARRAAFRLGAAAGIAGPAVFTGAWIASSLRQTRQGPGGLQLSGLAAPDARDPWIMLAGFLVLGGCTVAFGAALRAALGRGATGAGPAPALVQGAGLLTVAAGLLRRDHMLLGVPGEPGPSWHSNAHDAASGLIYASLVLAQLALARRFRRDPAWRRWGPWLLASAAATGALLIAYAADVTGPAAAAWQRGAVTLPQAAVAAIAARLMRDAAAAGIRRPVSADRLRKADAARADSRRSRLSRIVGRVELTVRRALIVGGAAAAVIAAAGTALATGLPSAPASRAAQAVSVPADGHATAALEIVSGTPLLSIRVARLGGTRGSLLRAAAAGGAPRPQVRVAGGASRVRSGDSELISLSASDGAPVTVTLNAAVTWLLDFAGGTRRTVADLRGGRVAGIVVAAGSEIVDLTLPRPSGMVPVRLAGGASQFLLSLPGGVPVRVTAAGGAGAVSLDGRDYTGVGGGSVFATPGWAAGAAGYDVDATAGAARIAVTRRAG